MRERRFDMTLWWQSLTTLEHVLLYVAVPAT